MKFIFPIVIVENNFRDQKAFTCKRETVQNPVCSELMIDTTPSGESMGRLYS